MRTFLTVIFLAVFTSVAMAELPTGYWPVEKTQPILDRTMRLTLDPDLSQLSEAESRAVDELLAAGAVIHELYEINVTHRRRTQNLRSSNSIRRAARRLLHKTCSIFFIYPKGR